MCTGKELAQQAWNLAKTASARFCTYGLSILSTEKSGLNNALCCYPNVNGSVRNLSLNSSTAPIFAIQLFQRKYWVAIWAQFHFLYTFVGLVDRIHETTHIAMFFHNLPMSLTHWVRTLSKIESIDLNMQTMQTMQTMQSMQNMQDM